MKRELWPPKGLRKPQLTGGADQRAEATTGTDQRAEATTGTDQRAEAFAWEVAKEEATNDARAKKPTANAVANDLRMTYPFCFVVTALLHTPAFLVSGRYSNIKDLVKVHAQGTETAPSTLAVTVYTIFGNDSTDLSHKYIQRALCGPLSGKT